MNTKIELNKERDFSEIFGDATLFLRKNGKQIAKCFVAIVAPVYTIASLIFSMSAVKYVNTSETLGSGPNALLDAFFNPLFILGIFLMAFAYLLSISVVFVYIKQYNENEEGEKILPANIWKLALRKVGKLLLYSIIYIFFSIIVVFIIVFVIGLLASATPALGIIFTVLLYIGYYFLILTYLSMLLPVIFYEDENAFETLIRCFHLVKGSLWQTLATTLVAALIISTIGGIFFLLFLIPYYLITVNFVTANYNLVKILAVSFFTIVPVIVFFLYSFYYVIISMQYHNLLEKLDHVGLRRKVDAMSQTSQQQFPEEY